MLFPTISFAIFFVVTILFYWGCIGCHVFWGKNPSKHLSKLVLLLASYVFYGIWDWRFLPLLLGSNLFNYIFARLLLWLHSAQAGLRVPKLLKDEVAPSYTQAQEQNSRIQRLQTFAHTALILVIGLNLGLLIFFKYVNWLLVNFNIVLHTFGMPLLFNKVTIILPLGISFFTFQNISFQVDIYRRKLRQKVSYTDYSLYIAFFPQLIAGPIVRAHSILPQLQRLPSPQNIYLSDAFTRIFIGLVKKIFIANTLSTHFVYPVFLVPSNYSSLELLLAAYAYSALIYCDFSAYSDMAVGLGLLCGIRLMENFNRPYACYSLQSFWRGWHISLSTWLRDYLYIPLGGNRKGNRYCNVIFTMLLGGLWHGASWNFLLWGGLHGIFISIEHFLGPKLSKLSKRQSGNGLGMSLGKKLLYFCGWLYSFHLITLAWIPFRAPNFAVAATYFRSLFRFDFFGADFSSMGNLTNIILLCIALGILPQILLPLKSRNWLIQILDSLPLIAQILVFAASLALLQVVLPKGVVPFIYYQF